MQFQCISGLVITFQSTRSSNSTAWWHRHMCTDHMHECNYTLHREYDQLPRHCNYWAHRSQINHVITVSNIYMLYYSESKNNMDLTIISLWIPNIWDSNIILNPKELGFYYNLFSISNNWNLNMILFRIPSNWDLI